MNLSLNIRLKAASILLICTILPMVANAEIDKKFYKKAAETVWGMNLPQFDPKADLSDSIFQNQSGIYIARYTSLDAKYSAEIDASKLSTIGLQNSNSTSAVYLRRTMVKLNDASAVEEFSEFSISPSKKEDYRGYVLTENKYAFGARIFKPDGTVKDVDMNEALTVTAGKRNEAAEHKIAIPGLVPGDILDFFYYTEYFYDEHSMPSFIVSFLAAYPTKNFTLDCRVDPDLALEYGAYNGAPKLTSFNKVGDQNQLFIEIQNIDALDEDTPYFSVARQMPFMDIHVLNNYARLQFVPKTARPGGIRHTFYAFLVADIASSILECKVNQKVINNTVSITKDWKEQHPQATDRQVVDAAWLALKYSLIKEDENITGRQAALMFSKVIDKLDLPFNGRVGVTSHRGNVPVTELVNFNDAMYVTFVGDTCYFPSNNLTLLPGELPEKYDGESYVMFDGRPDNPNLKNAAVPGTLPRGKANNNVSKVVTSLTIDPNNDEQIIATTNCQFTGSMKDYASSVISQRDCLQRISAYLGQKPPKDKKDYDAKAEEENIRERSEKLAGILWSSEKPELKEFRVIQPGCTPDSAHTEVLLKGVVSGAITQAGNNLMVTVGKFIGDQKQYQGKERQRDVSIILGNPNKFDTTITFEIPEGYEIVESSLADLNRSVITKEGTFNSEATVDGRTVTIRAIERYTRSIYPPQSWPSMLTVFDAIYEFNSASIILRPI